MCNIGCDTGNNVTQQFTLTGPGPFPGILDIYVFGGGLYELRASLLANKGFVTMALAYTGHGNLPKVPSCLDLEYFEKAVTLLLRQPKVIMNYKDTFYNSCPSGIFCGEKGWQHKKSWVGEKKNQVKCLHLVFPSEHYKLFY